MAFPPSEQPQFQATRWSLIRRAGGGDGEAARSALEDLCRAYWFPLYAFARRKGLATEDAQDVVQAFFARVIERRDFESVSPDKGRFRSFLLAALQHFVANWREHARAHKRGGGAATIAIDVAGADERLGLVARDSEPPERAFERAWARELMSACVDELQLEYGASGRRAVFEALKASLQGESYDPRRVADELGMTEGAVKVAAHRLRARFGEALRARIAQTVSSAEEVEDELRDLFRALRA